MLVCYLVVVVKLCCEKYKPLFVFFVFIPGCLSQYDVSAFEILPTIENSVSVEFPFWFVAWKIILNLGK